MKWLKCKTTSILYDIEPVWVDSILNIEEISLASEFKEDGSDVTYVISNKDYFYVNMPFHQFAEKILGMS